MLAVAASPYLAKVVLTAVVRGLVCGPRYVVLMEGGISFELKK